ncbi:MAG TPA: SRPBCC domain-containing protein [Vicinamibacterales bacterium]|nr:SRPBCC domain-containing protein [Vicinamibacterales bacterium]
MPDIRHSIPIDAAPERITQLVSSPEGLAAWWAEDVVRLAGADTLELGFFDRTTTYRLARAPEADGVRWRCETGSEWAGTELVFRAHRKANQTQLEFSHEGWASETPYFVSCNTVWGHLMFKLKEAAEGAAGARPLFTRSGMDTPAARLY